MGVPRDSQWCYLASKFIKERTSRSQIHTCRVSLDFQPRAVIKIQQVNYRYHNFNKNLKSVHKTSIWIGNITIELISPKSYKGLEVVI